MEVDVVIVSVISNVDDDTSLEIEFIIVEVTSVVVEVDIVVVDIVIAVAASMI